MDPSSPASERPPLDPRSGLGDADVRRRVPLRLRVAAVCVAPLLSLAVVEAGLRYLAHRENRETIGSLYVPPAESATGRTRLIDIIRPSEFEDLIYELRPNLDVEYKGAVVRTSSQGFRDDEHAPHPEEGTITIVGLGASIMFGHGVEQDEMYATILERTLNELHPERRWRFVNTAVPSYNVVMKVETLRRKGLAYGPDFVIVNVASNNVDLPSYVRMPANPFAADRSFLLDALQGIRRNRASVHERGDVLAFVDDRRLSWIAAQASDPESIPPEYRHLVGWDPFHAAMDDLAALAREHDFEVLFLAHVEQPVTRRILRAALDHGFHVTCTMDEVVAWMQEHLHQDFTVEGFLTSPLVIAPRNGHPSALLHEMIARRLARDMVERGVVGRLLGQS